MNANNISFFKPATHRAGIEVDHKAMDAITAEDMDSLSVEEAAFVRYYRAQRARGLKYLTLSHAPWENQGNPLLDIPQQEICEEHVRLMNAPDMPDKEVLG